MPVDAIGIAGSETANAPAGLDHEIENGHGSASDNAGPCETFGVGCPECGGALRIREGERSIRCPYCGSALFAAASRGVRRYFLPPRVTAGRARLEALRYLSEKTGGRIKARHAAILDMKQLNVPFWRMKGRLAGWVTGEKIKREQVEVSSQGPNGEKTARKTVEERVPYSKLIFKHVDWSSPACSVRHLGLQGISLKAQMLDWDIFDHSLSREMDIALPMTTAAEAERDGFKYLSGIATPAGATVRAGKFRMIGSDMSLYYYPVYLMRYRHAGSIHSITVDGSDGRVVRGDVPARNSVNFRAMFFVPALAALLAGLWVPLLPMTAAILYVSDMFRQGAVVAPHSWLLGKLETWFGGEL